MLIKMKTDWTIPTQKVFQYAKAGYKIMIRHNLAFLSPLKTGVYHKKRKTKQTKFTWTAEPNKSNNKSRHSVDKKETKYIWNLQ